MLKQEKGRDKKFDALRTKIWLGALFNAAEVTRDPELDERLGLAKEKNWPRYRRGADAPSPETLVAIDNVLSGTKRIFDLGPCRLFEIMKAESIRDAALAILDVIMTFCETSGLDITETPFCLENPSPADWLSELASSLYFQRNDYGFGDEIIPLALAIGHSASRFLGSETFLASYIFESLTYFADKYRIPVDAWEFDPEICLAAKMAGPLLRIRGLETGKQYPLFKGHQLSPSLRDQFELWQSDQNSLLVNGVESELQSVKLARN